MYFKQINEHWLQGVGSERVAAVLRGTGNHVRLVVARPANPDDPSIIRPNAPILPSALLTDQADLEKHLISAEMFQPLIEIEPSTLQLQQQQHQHLVDQTTSPIRDEFVARLIKFISKRLKDRQTYWKLKNVIQLFRPLHSVFQALQIFNFIVILLTFYIDKCQLQLYFYSCLSIIF